MALFKILKGQEKNLPVTKTEGWAYVTTDEGNMYVDVSASKRVRIGSHADKADVATKAEGDTESIRAKYLAKLKQVTSNGTTFTFRGETGDGSDAADLITIPLAGDKAGLISNAAQTIKGDKTFTGTGLFSKSSGFEYSGIENAGSDMARPVWFSYGDANHFGKPVINTSKFTYNPGTNTMVVGNINLNGLDIAHNYLVKIKQVTSDGTTFSFRGETGDGTDANDLITIPEASTSKAGLITTGAQAFAGEKTFTGQVVITGGTDAAAATANSGSLLIGSPTDSHIAIDANKIQAKSNGTTASIIYINNDGDVTQFGGNVQPKADNTQDIGTISKRWKEVFAYTFNATTEFKTVGNTFYANKDGNAFLSNNLSIVAANTNYNFYNDGTSYFKGKVWNPQGLLSFVQNNTVVDNTIDWNTLVIPGCYKIQMNAWGDAAIYHSPNAVRPNLYKYGLLFVIKGNDSDSEARTLQVYFPHSANSGHHVYCRMLNKGAWTTWYPIYNGALDLDGGTMWGTINAMNIIPKNDNTYTLGTSTKRWKEIFGYIFTAYTKFQTGSSYLDSNNDLYIARSVGIRVAPDANYALKVTDNSYFNGNTTHNGIDYFANGTTYFIDNSAQGNLSHLTIGNGATGMNLGYKLYVNGTSYFTGYSKFKKRIYIIGDESTDRTTRLEFTASDESTRAYIAWNGDKDNTRDSTTNLRIETEYGDIKLRPGSGYVNIRDSLIIEGSSSSTLRFATTDNNTVHTFIRAYADIGKVNSQTFVVKSGGTFYLGSGESANTLYEDLGEKATENMFFASDEDMFFYTNCDDSTNKFGIALDRDGQFYPLVPNTGSFGLGGYRWNHLYARHLDLSASDTGKAPIIIRGGSDSYREGIRIFGSGSATGWATITMGGDKESGTDANTWSIHTYNQGFYITHNGNNTESATGYLHSTSAGIWKIGPKLRVATNTSDYALNAASFICDDWVRTKGATGWYNETYQGGWYMTDTNYIRNYNNKAVLLSSHLYFANGTTYYVNSSAQACLNNVSIGGTDFGYKLYVEGNSYLNGDISKVGNIYPLANNNKNLGSSSLKWANVYATTFHGNLDGNASSVTNGVYVFGRSSIGTSPNFDNPGKNGLFEVRVSSETTGETGTKPYNGYGPILSLKTPDNIAMLQIAAGGTSSFYYRANQSENVTLSGIAWKRLWQQGDAVTGAVWNDYAECRQAETQEAGYVLYETGSDDLKKTIERLQHFAGVSSDTWGFSQGETEKAKTPIAVAGRVLVYTYQNRNNYKPGDCVCAAPGGTVDIMTREEVVEYPDRIVGTVSCVPTYEEWGGGEGADRDPVKVNGRIWIKVK